MSTFTWAEDDFSLPPGVERRLDLSAPTDGRTYVMYHGTSAESAKSILAHGFRPSEDGMLGPGVYLSRDLEKASHYALHLNKPGVVFKVKVNVGKVIAINEQPHPLQKKWHYNGYNTAWVPPNCGMVKSGLEENCVWNPKRITILSTISPKISSQRDTKWAEDDFSLPPGVERRLDSSAPTCGRTYVMYHGTSAKSTKSILAKGFRPSKDGMLGPGVYLSRDVEKASAYPLQLHESQRVVFKVKVNVGKVIAINYQGHPMQKKWHYNGYDTAWVPPESTTLAKSGLEENCIWDPKRITILSTITPCRFTWAEDDFSLPHGVERRLDSSAPTCDRTYVMYHGTTSKRVKSILAQGFTPWAGRLGPGVYLSRDVEKACSRFPLNLHESQRVVFKVKVNVGKVITIDNKRHAKKTTWHLHGYDTAWVPPNCSMVKDRLEETWVWDPKRITILSSILPQISGTQQKAYP